MLTWTLVWTKQENVVCMKTKVLEIWCSSVRAERFVDRQHEQKQDVTTRREVRGAPSSSETEPGSGWKLLRWCREEMQVLFVVWKSDPAGNWTFFRSALNPEKQLGGFHKEEQSSWSSDQHWPLNFCISSLDFFFSWMPGVPVGWAFRNHTLPRTKRIHVNRSFPAG